MNKRFLMKMIELPRVDEDGEDTFDTYYVTGEAIFEVDNDYGSDADGLRGVSHCILEEIEDLVVEDMDGNELKNYPYEEIIEVICSRIWDWMDI